MRKFFPILCFAIALCCVFAFIACDNEDNTAPDFKLSFVVDGVVVHTISTDGESKITLPDEPQKAGYTFDGWYWDEKGSKKVTVDSLLDTPIGNDMSVYARFSIVDYTISYQNTMDVDNDNPTTFNANSDTLTLLPLAKEGYIFANWTDESENAITAISTSEFKDRTITANWTLCVNHVRGENCKCTLCGATAHATIENCACSACGTPVHTVNDNCFCSGCGRTVHGVKEGAYCRHDDYVYFGAYPQTEVKDSAVTSALNTMAGTLPTEENSQKWTDYGYYLGNENYKAIRQSYMWYIDLVKDGVKYRGVYFTDYRLYSTNSRYLNDGDTYQDDYGYVKGNVYWFAFEPIKWRILTEDDGIATLLCDVAIDTQNVSLKANNGESEIIDGKRVYDNNYEHSVIRVWLNENFYNTAFDQLQKSVIQLTTVDNSARSANSYNNETKWDTERRACGDTQDYVYLPSIREMTNPDYGFDPNYLSADTARQRSATDYAAAQGCYYECNWWMRSPRWSDTYCMRIVDVTGRAGYTAYSVNGTSTAVVPVVRIEL